ncbi:DUF6894 family protein [Pseudoroseicyclus aestuarii]|uniref:DUF6894 domain-containing protein n=1 Tax=Pseudoroseicyclus aestuarii TaxID=1795041 RepID=A0A318SMD9_9RHOB|nr:hypothetical protein [Pseudoroseicyclus aestuarii]PYE80845.1 hypothetical protein DFP88_1108 [Pseudoroseicyclus aestuarii]
MPLFYFDINDGTRRRYDTEGQELASFEVATQVAAQELALIIKDEHLGGTRQSYIVTVRDQGGIPVFVATAMMLGEPLGLPS